MLSMSGQLASGKRADAANRAELLLYIAVVVAAFVRITWAAVDVSRRYLPGHELSGAAHVPPVVATRYGHIVEFMTMSCHRLLAAWLQMPVPRTACAVAETPRCLTCCTKCSLCSVSLDQRTTPKLRCRRFQAVPGLDPRPAERLV